MALLAPIALLPVDAIAIVWLIAMVVAVVLTLRRQSLYWIFFVPLLQCLFLGQLDPFFWLIYRSKRPGLLALLSLKPQLLLPALPRILASRRNFLEFLIGLMILHVPFLLLRPRWPIEWITYLSSYGQNRLTRVLSATTSGQIMFSAWLLPFAIALTALLFLRPKNQEGLLFLANPALLPYDFSLLMGGMSKIIIPLSWVALWVAWQFQAGWPYAAMLLVVLVFETIRERQRLGSGSPGQP
jgi:hypothetical protein